MKNIIYVIVALVLIAGGIFGYRAIYKSSPIKYNTPSSSAASPTPTTTQKTANQVSISNFAFTPSTLTVSAGTTVRFTNNDSVTHDIVANNNSFNSGHLAPGSSFTHTFTQAGTYQYHCSIHPTMRGTIVVQ